MLALEVDAYGHVTMSASIAYARRTIPAGMPQGLLATVTETVVNHEPSQTIWYRLGVPIETRTYELTGLDTQRARFAAERWYLHGEQPCNLAGRSRCFQMPFNFQISLFEFALLLANSSA